MKTYSNKPVTIKAIEEILYHLFTTGQISLTQYVGNDLYRIADNCIVTEKVLERIHEKIRNSIKDGIQIEQI